MSQIPQTQPVQHVEMEDPNLPAPEASVTGGSTTASSSPAGATAEEQSHKRHEREAVSAAVEHPVPPTPAGSPSGLTEAMGVINLLSQATQEAPADPETASPPRKEAKTSA